MPKRLLEATIATSEASCWSWGRRSAATLSASEANVLTVLTAALGGVSRRRLGFQQLFGGGGGACAAAAAARGQVNNVARTIWRTMITIAALVAI